LCASWCSEEVLITGLNQDSDVCSAFVGLWLTLDVKKGAEWTKTATKMEEHLASVTDEEARTILQDGIFGAMKAQIVSQLQTWNAQVAALEAQSRLGSWQLPANRSQRDNLRKTLRAIRRAVTSLDLAVVKKFQLERDVALFLKRLQTIEQTLRDATPEAEQGTADRWAASLAEVRQAIAKKDFMGVQGKLEQNLGENDDLCSEFVGLWIKAEGEKNAARAATVAQMEQLLSAFQDEEVRTLLREGAIARLKP
jgi:hypothetical protein